MTGSAAARDRLYRSIEPLIGAENAALLMDARPPSSWSEVATKADLHSEITGLRAEMREGFAEMRERMAAFVTRDELAELLRLHVDARLAANTRATLMWSVAMNATMLGAVIAAIRL
jgi:hypothetical protein